MSQAINLILESISVIDPRSFIPNEQEQLPSDAVLQSFDVSVRAYAAAAEVFGKLSEKRK